MTRVVLRSFDKLSHDPETVVIDFGRRVISRDRERVKLTGLPLSIAAALLSRAGVISPIEFIDHLWGDRADGGPDHAVKGIHVQLHHLRPKLSLLGISIVTTGGRGWSAEIAPADVWRPRQRIAA